MDEGDFEITGEIINWQYTPPDSPIERTFYINEKPVGTIIEDSVDGHTYRAKIRGPNGAIGYMLIDGSVASATERATTENL